jgi:hypothetical protein
MPDTRTLDVACRRYEAAEHGRIIEIRLEWPELDEFFGRLREYWSEARVDPEGGIARGELSALYELGRLLARNAVDPGHPDAAGPQMSCAGDDDARFASLRAACARALEALRASRHPASSLSTALADAGVRLPGNDARVAIVARQRHHDAIRSTIDLPGRAYRIVTQTQLKTSGMWDLAVYLGPQESAYLHVPIERRRQEVAWMYSAPAAPVTVQVDWAFGAFAAADFSIWPEAPLTVAAAHGARRNRVEPPEVATLTIPPVPPPTLGGVNATVFDLPDEYRVAFAEQIPPKLWLVEADDFEVEVSAQPPSRVDLGSIILLRLDRTARDYVRREARSAMGADAYDAAAALRDEFKARVVEAARHPDAEALVIAQGLNNPTYYFRVCEHPDYICAGTLAAYEKLCRGLGIPRDAETYRTIVELRRYHRQAGHGAKTVIETDLRTDRSWEEAIRETGVSRRTVPDMGELLIGPVLAKTETLRPVAVLGEVTRRGVPVN